MKKVLLVLEKLFFAIGRGLKSLFLTLFFPGKRAISFDEEALTSPTKAIIKKFFKSKTAVLGLISFTLIFASVFILSSIYPAKDSDQDTTQINIPPGYNIQSIPKQLVSEGILSIDSGAVTSIGVSNSNKAYVWGSNLRVINQNITPAIREAMNNTIKASAGLNHFLIEDSNGNLHSWGANASAHIDANNPRARLYVIPDELQTYTGGYRQILAARQFSAVVTNAGTLHIWGNLRIVGISQSSVESVNAYGPIRKIQTNLTNLVVLYEDNTMRVIGQTGTAISAISAIRTNVADFAITHDAGVLTRTNGETITWGSSLSPIVKDFPTGLRATTLVSGYNFVTAIDEDGKVFSWGDNRYNQLDFEKKSAKTTISQLYSGGYQVYGVADNGKVISAGLRGYLMGTDSFGRDIFRRLAQGGRVTLTVGAVAVLIATVIGVIVGGVAGFFGGRIDNILMRFTEVVNSIPFLPIAMTLSVLIGSRLTTSQRMYMIMIILGVLSWGGLARLVRGQVLAEREKDFVLAARALGIRQRKIIFNHIIPNVISIIIVSVTLSYAGSLLTESSLSFLGFGVVPPTPTWGNMLSSAQTATVISQFWWIWVFPALAISLSTLSINFIGDGLRNAIDPKSSER